MISVVVLTKNEEKNLARCLASVAFCDEILVIDDFSTDKTSEIAKRYKAKVFKRRLEGDFSAQRNFGLLKARGDFVLFIDADEEVTESLKREIIQAVRGKKAAFEIERVDFLWGKKISSKDAVQKFIRLARKDAGLWRRKVHEKWEVEGSIGTLVSPLFHYPHETVSEFIDEISFYSTLHAQANYEEGKTAKLWIITLFPLLKFLKSYFLGRGFRDGLHGFILAAIMSFHSFLAWSKLWLIQKNK